MLRLEVRLTLLCTAFLAAGASGQNASLVADIRTAPLTSNSISSFPRAGALQCGAHLYFVATDAVHGFELWRTDGTPAGTELAMDVWPGPNSGCDPYNGGSQAPNPLFAGPDGSVMFFAFIDGFNSLWRVFPDGAVRQVYPNSASDTTLFTLNNQSANPPPVRVGNTVFFAAMTTSGTTSLGQALWASDGTAAGTRVVFDPTTSTVNVVGAMAALGNRLIFACNGLSGTGVELWQSDGTTVGTTLVKDINPTQGMSSSPHSFAEWNGHLYFFAYPINSGQSRFFRTDGTEAGTVQLSTTALGNNQPSPGNEQIVATNEGVYFINSVGAVCRWDGTGPEPVTTGAPATLNSTVRVLSAVDNLVYSIGNQRLYKREANGSITTLTTGTAFAVADLFPVEAGPTWPARMYFNGGTSATNSEPWVTDGTPAGTIALKDVQPGTQSSFPRWMGTIAGKAIAYASDGSLPNGTGTEPWVTNGTPVGTVLLRDISTQSSNGFPTDFFAFGGSLFFDALTDTFGIERHRLTLPNTATMCDETLSGSQAWSRDEPTVAGENVFSRVSINNTISIRASQTGEGLGTELVSTSGSTTYNGRLYSDGTLCYFQFRAAGATTDDYSVPWRSDGSAQGTFPLATTTVGQPSNVFAWTQYQGETYFLAKYFTGSTDTSYALYATSGETGNTRIIPGAGGGGTPNSTTLRLLTANNKLFYNAFSVGAQTQLWVYDHASSTFGRVRPNSTSVGSQLYCTSPATLNDRVIWGADIDQSQDGELWITDGTESGTTRIKDIQPGLKGSFPAGMTTGPSVSGPRVYFAANDGSTGRELWVTDGTASGTMLVKDIHPGIAGSFPQSFVAMGDRMYFLASDGVHGMEWWVTDGTESGTHLMADIYPGAATSTYLLSGASYLPFVLQDKLFFAADSPGIGRELWMISANGGVCGPDFNADTVLDLFDYLDFVAAFASSDPISDFNSDTVVDFFDYLDFVAAFAAGC